MDALELRASEAVFQRLQCLRRHELLVSGENPHDFTVRLKGVDLVQVEQVEVMALPPDDLRPALTALATRSALSSGRRRASRVRSSAARRRSWLIGLRR